MVNIKYYYVYKITDKKRKKYYIGSRTSEIPPDQDLGHVYFSSSTNRKFITEQRKTPNQFIYEIIKTFSDIEQALKYETELIQQKNALNDKNYYNGRTRLNFAATNSRATKSTVSYLGNLIKLARKERGFSQHELAERINVSRSSIQRVELGNTKAHIGVVFEACFVLGIPLMGCDKEHVNNLSRMLSYMNRLIPGDIQNKNIDFNDNF
jgi:ribosome-binding protein aMBF1 (putative translation factor)